MKKLMNKKGFTLAELLIVVAIIGVLTVVAVPVFTTQLEKSREAADIANMREAMAAAASAYLQEEEIVTGSNKVQLGSAQTGDATVYYDASSGKLAASIPSTGYGKGTSTVGDAKNTLYGYKPDAASVGGPTVNSYAGLKIKITVSKDGTVSLDWE